jgi:hypothetical protein
MAKRSDMIFFCQRRPCYAASKIRTGTCRTRLPLSQGGLKRAGVTYEELANRLKKHGLDETRDSVASKLKRGTFAATFMLACLAALELDGIRLEDI